MALAMVLIGAGVTLYVALGHGSRGGASAIPGVIDLGAPSEGGEGLGKSENARLQFADPKDPTRVQAELAYESLDPVGQGLYRLTKPEGWVFFRDGRTLYVKSETGRVRMAGPGRAQEAEGGEFSGGVLVLLFAPKAGGGAIDPAKDEPALMAWTNSVTFDTTVLELTSDDEITISTPGLLFVGQGLVVRGNEVKQRLELVSTRGELVRINPDMLGKRRGGPTASAGVAAGAATGGADSPAGMVAAGPADAAAVPVPAVVRETLYRCLATGELTIEQGPRKARADTLEVLARTINNQLPDGAIAAVALAEMMASAGRGAGESARAARESVVVTADATAFVGPPAPETVGGTEQVATVNTAASAGNLASTGNTAGQPPHSSPTTTAGAEAARRTGASAGVPTMFVSAGEQDVLMRWTGPLVLTPIATDADTPLPAMLADGNHLGVRLSAERPGGETAVTVVDEVSGATGTLGVLEYRATSRDVAAKATGMSGAGGGAEVVTFAAPGAARYTGDEVRVNLGTGIGAAIGAGMLRVLDRDGREQGGLIRWTDQADFALRMHRGKLSSALEMASFTGGVLAMDGRSSIGGDYLRAEFAPVGGVGGGGGERAPATAMTALKVRGNAVLAGGARGAGAADGQAIAPRLDPNLRADELDVSFKRTGAGGGDVEPTFAEARGAVRGQTDDALFGAGKIEAQLAREKGEVVVRELLASGQPRFERVDGVYASAETMRVYPQEKTAELRAETAGAVVSVGRDTTRILGTRVRLDDDNKVLTVVGAGRFEHVQPGALERGGAGDVDAGPTRVQSSWTTGMTYDDLRGTIISRGDVEFRAASVLDVHQARAEEMRIDITPAEQASTALAANASSDAVLGGRRVLRAEAIGGIVEKAGGSNAQLESYRYAAAPGLAAGEVGPPAPLARGVREQVVRVEGPRVVFDDAAGTFVVPSAGFAIVRDERAADGPGGAGGAGGETPMNVLAAGAAASGGTRGTSRLAWSGTGTFDRVSGTLTATRDVELVHLAPGATAVTRIIAGSMKAQFGGGGVNGSELERAEAIGAAYAENGPTGQQQKLLGDTFVYDARTGVLEASSGADNRVTFYDDRKPTPIIARRLKWDLVKDRVDVTEMAPVLAPR